LLSRRSLPNPGNTAPPLLESEAGRGRLDFGHGSSGLASCDAVDRTCHGVGHRSASAILAAAAGTRWSAIQALQVSLAAGCPRRAWGQAAGRAEGDIVWSFPAFYAGRRAAAIVQHSCRAHVVRGPPPATRHRPDLAIPR